MVYADGTTVEGSTHPQVDSGFGFTCDEEILPFIAAFYSVGMQTLGSCQGISAWSPAVIVASTFSATPTGFPRRWIAYTHTDPQVVFNFALYIRDGVGEIGGWAQAVMADHHSAPDAVFAALEFTPDFDAKMLDLIKAWEG